MEIADPTTVYCDNVSNVQCAKNSVFHARTKHIKVHYHFVCKRVLSGEVELAYVSTNWQMVDILNKPLGLGQLHHILDLLGLQHLDVPHLRGGAYERVKKRLDEREKLAEEAELDKRMTRRKSGKGTSELEPTKHVGRTRKG